MMDKSTATKQINEWGASKTPFIFLIDFELQKIKLFKVGDTNEELFFDFNGFSNHTTSSEKPDHSIIKSIISFPKEKYLEAFESAQKHIQYGNSFLLNLTARSEIKTDFKLKEIFESSFAKYKVYLKDKFVCFSPECFIKIDGQKIFSYPMKGTIDASIPNARELLLNDIKEKSEHNTIVDLIRNDISQFSKNVCVPRFRYLDKIEAQERTLLQVSSEVMGELPNNYNEILGDILFAQLPAGSISGAPKRKTLEIISEAENMERGYYTGVAGYYNGEILDSCVLIRFIEKENEKLYYRSGGGITFMSKVESEYQELLQKIYVPTH